jgi:hypothetical protein
VNQAAAAVADLAFELVRIQPVDVVDDSRSHRREQVLLVLLDVAEGLADGVDGGEIFGRIAEQQVGQRFFDARRELERIVVLRLDRRRRHAHHVLLLRAQVQVLADAEHDLAHDLAQAVQHLLGLLVVEALRLQAGTAEERVERWRQVRGWHVRWRKRRRDVGSSGRLRGRRSGRGSSRCLGRRRADGGGSGGLHSRRRLRRRRRRHGALDDARGGADRRRLGALRRRLRHGLRRKFSQIRGREF